MSPLACLIHAEACAPFPLTVRQLAVLLYLGRVGREEFPGVREALGMSPPALTRAADTLAVAKLLKRTPSTDRRVPMLSLTDAGKALADKLEGAP